MLVQKTLKSSPDCSHNIYYKLTNL